jgi:hypothetical protein
MRGREVALPESLRELWAKWINAGGIAVLRVDHTTDLSFTARTSTGSVRTADFADNPKPPSLGAE